MAARGDTNSWFWPVLAAAAILIFAGETLSAVDEGWPLGRTLLVIAMAGFVAITVVRSFRWWRERNQASGRDQGRMRP